MARTKSYSLQRRLLIRLWIPLCLVLIAGALGTVWLARDVASFVYDRWLYDSAMTLAQQIEVRDGRGAIDMPPPAIDMFEWDSSDRVFGEVVARNHGVLFRTAAFPPPPDRLVAGRAKYYDGEVGGHATRIVAILVRNAADDYVIQVAETRRKRQSIIERILIYAVPFQALLLVITGAVVWYAVTSGLRVVHNLATDLSRYEPESLPPVQNDAQTPEELRPLLNALNQLIAKLSDAQAAQRRFIANAAHQIRTPLTTLQVQTERALRETDEARRTEALLHVLTAVTRSRRLAHQLLTLAKSEPSAVPMLRIAPVDLAELARDEVERWADSAIERGIDLGYDGPDAGVVLPLDPVLMRELIGNLVDNAIRYGREGGVVTLGLHADPVSLTVDDDGPGIPVAERELVFERFYRRAGTPGDGCGLGLPIAKEIAARHGALLRILDNPASGGTRMEVVFPAA